LHYPRADNWRGLTFAKMSSEREKLAPARPPARSLGAPV